MATKDQRRWFHRTSDHAVVRSTGWAILHTSKAAHRLLGLATGLLVITSCLLLGAAWRLAQGPIDLGPFADRARAALADDTGPVHVTFGGLALAWEGFQKGADYPLDVRISTVSITDPMGRKLVSAPDAHLTFSFAGLLLGRFVLRTIEVDHGQVTITRNVKGLVNLQLDQDVSSTAATGSVDLRNLRAQLARPVGTDRGRSQTLLAQIVRVHFRDTDVTVRDQGSGLIAKSEGLDLDLVRGGNGLIHGSLAAPLSVGDEHMSMTAAVDLGPNRDTTLKVRLTPFRPAGIGALPPALAFLSDVDLPVAATATVAFDDAFRLAHMQITGQLGLGHIRVGNGALPLRSGRIVLAGTMDRINITEGFLDLGPSDVGQPETADVTGSVARVADRLAASLRANVSNIDAANLSRVWPAGINDNARGWVVEHVTGGTATHGTASFVVETDEALRDVVVTRATGTLDVTNAAFTWIDHVPPIEQAEVHLQLVDPDTLEIHLARGRQRITDHGPDLLVEDGQMRITGLSFRDQIAEIHARVAGPVVSALSLLGEPRLHLLSAHPLGLKPAGGDVATTLDIQFPLEQNLQIDDVRIHADAHLTHVRVMDVAGGHQLDDGVFDLGIDKDGLSLSGGGVLAGVPVTLKGALDFNAGGPDEIIQKITAVGQPDATQLDAAGLHVTDVVSGPIPMTAVMIERRNGNGSISITGDLTAATLEVAPLAWSKPAGAVSNATATLLMSHDRLTKIDHIAVNGDGLLVSGTAGFSGSHVRSVLLDTIRLGRSEGHGTIHIETNGQIDVALQGTQIDLSAKLTEKSSSGEPASSASVTAPAWTLDARFDHAILANGENATDILAHVTGAGGAIRFLDLLGATQGNAGFSVKIGPRADTRLLSVDVKDAGHFLRGIDAVRGMQSGHLTVNGVFDGPVGLRSLAGTTVITDVVVRNSPILGKLLQAITLYGLVDVLSGPGMAFSRIVAPFHYDGTHLYLDDAHAANPSLGLTARGSIALSSGKISLAGTIVPAYFFNSMLGQLPLVGKLFSPEKGGGVFAVRFGLEGPTDDLTVTINPISGLTPGFLRDIFGIFDDRGTSGKAPP